MIGNILLYTLTPQIKPRLNNFLSSSFGFLASFMAQAYRGVRLLPENHPFLQSRMHGQYGVFEVLREASSNLNFSTKNIDQIIVFFALLAGMVILGIQFILLIVALLVNSASAQDLPSNIGEFFVRDDNSEDLALRLLDKVFGIPDFFGTKDAPGEAAEPFHTALHQLFQFYSIGLLVIAAIIIAYYIFAIVAETAQTGTPFGKRYNHVWAPIRLVVAIGLLIPISTGLNSAQWITLYAAKWGSGFATNGWIMFLETFEESIIAGDELIAEPNPPEIKDFVAFMSTAHACKAAYIALGDPRGENIDAYIIDPNNVNDATPLMDVLLPWNNEFLKAQRKIHIRFGVENAIYSDNASNVYPFCGEIALTNNVPGENAEADSTGQKQVSAAQVMTWGYYALIYRMWENGDALYGDPLRTAAESRMESIFGNIPTTYITDSYKTERQDITLNFVKQRITNAANALKEEFELDPETASLGWGGGGIWPNTIANANGLLTGAAMNKPTIVSMPSVMEYTCKENQQENEETTQIECYNPRMSEGTETLYQTENDSAIASALSDFFNFWYKDSDETTGNIFIDTVNLLLGTQGLFDMCRNADIHPLAQLSATGKGLVDAAIRNLGFGFLSGSGGLLTPYFGPALQAASGFFVSLASVGILIGFILYYVVPFMPFLYFLFAVGGWVKGLFEAMVGVPLWALAHIRIDGQGLAGDAAINGYFLIFEIFVRPILIVFGLLASLIIFSAMVKVLNEVFALAVSNLSGYSTANEGVCDTAFPTSPGAPTGSVDYMRGPIDEFFFTVVYAILVYMIGMACFKLIDLIPNQILRWMGAGVSTFNDNAGEPAEGLVTKLAVGGGIMGGQLQQAGSAAGQVGGSLASVASKLVR